jgi:hypothetical protein
MSLAKIYKHYKITPQKLKELLGANGIDVDLRFVKEVPDEWGLYNGFEFASDAYAYLAKLQTEKKAV